MVKLESSVTPIPALSDSTLPQLGFLASAGAALIIPACAALDRQRFQFLMSFL